MNDLIQEAMFEFVQDVELVFERGWKVKGLQYGERRLGIGPSLIMKKDDQEVICYTNEDVLKLP